MNKKWLASVGGAVLFRLRRTQAICYASLLLNIVLILCLVAVIRFGR